MNKSASAQGKKSHKTLWQIFRNPIWIGLLSIIGLIAALVGNGWYDGVSWLALAVPVLLSLWYGWWVPKRKRCRQ